MNRILRIDASPRDDDSVSRRIADRVVASLGGPVTRRDLTRDAPPHVTGEMVASYFTPPAERGEAQRAAIAASDEVVAELRAADVVVIATPIYNFGVPASLKAWADLAARVGETFRYGADGPEGLLKGKRAILVIASGGTGVDSGIDWATPWLRFFLGFIGIDDVTVLAADGLNAGAEEKIAAACERADALAPLAA